MQIAQAALIAQPGCPLPNHRRGAEEARPDAVARRRGRRPVRGGGKADPTFKQLFTSWKKLDTLQDGAIAVPSDKPVKTGAFTSGYGMRADPFARPRRDARRHRPCRRRRTPIYATADGVITDAGYNSGGYGNLVKIDHGRGIETRYGHLSKISVYPGQRVKRGEQIGRMGSTGRSTGSHLHYEVRIDGRAGEPGPVHEVDRLSARHAAQGQRRSDGPGCARRPDAEAR